MSSRTHDHNNTYYRDLQEYILMQGSNYSSQEVIDQINALSIFISLTDSAYLYNPPFLVSKYEKMSNFIHSAYQKYNIVMRIARHLLKDESIKLDIQDSNAQVFLKLNNLWEVDLLSFSEKSGQGISLCESFSLEDAFLQDHKNIYTLLWKSSKGVFTFAVTSVCEERPPLTGRTFDKVTNALYRIITQKENDK